ncbi:hypothetical protein OIU77_006723, partial [Salix suchowensis]
MMQLEGVSIRKKNRTQVIRGNPLHSRADQISNFAYNPHFLTCFRNLPCSKDSHTITNSILSKMFPPLINRFRPQVKIKARS